MKKYLNKNVYEAAKERTAFIFKNFERIYVSFSGGKDSSVLLNIALDYMRAHKIKRKIGVLFLDLEGQYNITIDYVREMLTENADLLEPYWICLPLTCATPSASFSRSGRAGIWKTGTNGCASTPTGRA